MQPQIAPIGQSRNANNSIYPLRGADGLTFAERKNRQLEAGRARQRIGATNAN